MEDNMTQEEIQSSVRAAFDSVNLINGIVDGTQMANESAQEKEDTVERNVGHLNIMMGKSWFADALTDQENTDISAAITAGNGYSA
jgi:hypothetical protein